MGDQYLDGLTQAALFRSARKLYSAWQGHYYFASWVTASLNPKVFVELGTYWGGSYFVFCQTIKKNKLQTQSYALDTWEGDDHAGYYGEEVYKQCQQINAADYADFSHLLRMSFDAGVEMFKDGSVDLLHIDGLHTYEAIRHDFETWLPRLSPGAVVLLHDTQVTRPGFGVAQYWREIQARYPWNLEFEHSYGLGVFQIGGIDSDKIIPWLKSEPLKREVKEYFSSIGGMYHDLEISKDEVKRLSEELLAIRSTKAYRLSCALSEMTTWSLAALGIKKYQEMRRLR